MASGFGLWNQSNATEAEIDSSTPWVAAADGNLPLLQAALNQLRIPVTAVDDTGYTLLQAAASYGHVAVLSWLLSQLPSASSDGLMDARTSFLNARDNEGDSALHYASTSEAANLLIKSGIDPNIRNKDGKTALESKQAELDEAMADDDFDDDDEDATNLRSLLAYLSSLQTKSQ